ncbi:MAG: small subunit ribosomal protein S13 [Planctomycetota bacterium]|jgi:small subunit ribosomal protein S13
MRILGITIPDNKQMQYGLTVLYGVGLSRAQAILKETKVDPVMKAKDVSQDQENAIRKATEEFLLEGDLRRQVSQNIKRLKDTNCYRGMRHRAGLTSRGQRTKTNSRTVRGNKRNTMASGRRKTEKT